MPITCLQAENHCELALAGALTIMEVTELRDQIALAVRQCNGPVHVDLSAVSELDSSGLQLLLALRREGSHIQLLAPSPSVQVRIGRFGLRTALHLEGAQHGA